MPKEEEGSPTSKASDAWLTAELLQILHDEGMTEGRGWVPDMLYFVVPLRHHAKHLTSRAIVGFCKCADP